LKAVIELLIASEAEIPFRIITLGTIQNNHSGQGFFPIKS